MGIIALKNTPGINYDLDGDALSLLSSATSLRNNEYLSRKAILGTRTFEGYRNLPIRSVSESEIRMPIGQLLEISDLEYLASMNAHHFHIDENYYQLLKPIVGEMDKVDICLPYPTTVFHLTYREGSPFVILRQDQETKEIESINVKGRPEHSEFIKEALAICVALDIEIIGKSKLLENLGRMPKKGSMASRSFKILKLKTVPKIIEGSYNVNTGRKSPAMHFRRGCWSTRNNKKFWRRWTIVGLIDNGIVVKDYKA